MIAAGEFVYADGRPVCGDEPYEANTFVWFHRPLVPEPSQEWDLRVLHRDERLVVVDKPPGLATTPRGTHVTQTAVVLLRRALDLPDLSPAHRLDRLTAGVLVLTTEQQWRRPYQEAFEQRRVAKVYEAIAPLREGLAFPRTVRSHIVKRRGDLQAVELPEEPPNAETTVDLLETRGGLARYRLVPRTGRTHQLRVHLNRLGIPILGDPLYPAVAGEALDGDLHLVAREVSFRDPVDGSQRDFASDRLLTWPG
ncbi:MAG: pseudouridine synthase [Propioniciclava sp.]